MMTNALSTTYLEEEISFSCSLLISFRQDLTFYPITVILFFIFLFLFHSLHMNYRISIMCVQYCRSFFLLLFKFTKDSQILGYIIQKRKKQTFECHIKERFRTYNWREFLWHLHNSTVKKKTKRKMSFAKGKRKRCLKLRELRSSYIIIAPPTSTPLPLTF